MKNPKRKTPLTPAREIAALRARLAASEDTLLAIRTGEVDTVVVTGKEGSQVFTLEGADHPYRVLIESMKGGALTLSADAVILYANQHFADMVKLPLQKVLGATFQSLLATEDQEKLPPMLKRLRSKGSKMEVLLKAQDGVLVPALMALRPLEKETFNQATIGMVVTDLTESKRNEEMLRALTNKVVEAQESERGRVAFELHDGITQLVCAMLFQCQALVGSLPNKNGPAMKAALKLSQLAGKTAEEVERISRNLRPSVLENLGLHSALCETCTEFSKRTRITVKLDCAEHVTRIPVQIELALFRILQEGLRNIEKHAEATLVNVHLLLTPDSITMKIKDNGAGFEPIPRTAGKKIRVGLGLLSMRERATHLGGHLHLKSVRNVGTEIIVSIPLATKA